MSNKEFWDLIKSFLSNKRGLASRDISLVKNETIAIDDKELTKDFQRPVNKKYSREIQW